MDMNEHNKAIEDVQKAREKQEIMDRIRRARVNIERKTAINKEVKKSGCGGCWKK